MIALLAALLVGTGLACIVYGIGERARVRAGRLQHLIEAELAEPSGSPERLNDLMERAGAFTDRLIGSTTLAARVQLMLTRAGWSLRPGELAAVGAVIALGAGAGVWLVTGSLLWGAGSVTLTPPAAVALLRAKGHNRVRKVEEQLPTVLRLLSGSLDSGASVLHAMEVVAEEGDPPLAPEFSRVVAETRVGRPVIEALEGMAGRVGSRDLDWTVSAIRIQHQTGGKLADTLRVLADFMEARLEVRGEVRALSAEARISAKVLTVLPIAVAGFLFLFRGSYFEPLYTTPMGRAMILAAAAGLGLGSLWMRRIARVEV